MQRVRRNGARLVTAELSEPGPRFRATAFGIYTEPRNEGAPHGKTGARLATPEEQQGRLARRRRHPGRRRYRRRRRQDHHRGRDLGRARSEQGRPGLRRGLERRRCRGPRLDVPSPEVEGVRGTHGAHRRWAGMESGLPDDRGLARRPHRRDPGQQAQRFPARPGERPRVLQVAVQRGQHHLVPLRSEAPLSRDRQPAGGLREGLGAFLDRGTLPTSRRVRRRRWAGWSPSS